MGAVAERSIPRVAAAAKCDGRAPPEAKFLALLIHDREVALDANRTVAEDDYFCASQVSLHI